MRLILFGMAALALAGCSGKKEEAPANAIDNAANAAGAMNAGNVTNVAATVAGLSKEQRDGVLFRAIRDAGLPCQDIKQSEAMEPTQGKATWRAQCEDDAYHLIVINPDGNAQVISRPTP